MVNAETGYDLLVRLAERIWRREQAEAEGRAQPTAVETAEKEVTHVSS